MDGVSLTGTDKAQAVTDNETGRARDGFGVSLTGTDKAPMITGNRTGPREKRGTVSV